MIGGQREGEADPRSHPVDAGDDRFRAPQDRSGDAPGGIQRRGVDPRVGGPAHRDVGTRAEPASLPGQGEDPNAGIGGVCRDRRVEVFHHVRVDGVEALRGGEGDRGDPVAHLRADPLRRHRRPPIRIACCPLVMALRSGAPVGRRRDVPGRRSR